MTCAPFDTDTDDYDPPGRWSVTEDMEAAGLGALRRAKWASIPAEDVPQYIYRCMMDNSPLWWTPARYGVGFITGVLVTWWLL